MNEGIDGKENTAEQVAYDIYRGRAVHSAGNIQKVSPHNQYGAHPANDLN